MYVAAQLESIPETVRQRCLLVFPCTRDSLVPPKSNDVPPCRDRQGDAVTY